MKKIGLALGGGGAKGFAHIPFLEVFDELGIKPYCITGTSVGGVLGALYSSGHSAASIVGMIGDLIKPSPKSSFRDIFRKNEILQIMQLLDPQFSLKPKGLIKGDKLLGILYDQLGVDTFEELSIPLKVVATDFWRKEAVIFSKGDLIHALRASMAIPYVFTPVEEDGRVLVDGGLVNTVPHELLSSKCDFRIAIDIQGDSSTPCTKPPTALEAMSHSYDVMQETIAREKLINNPVDIYLRPPITDIGMIDFYKARTIYEQGQKAKDDFKRQLEQLIEGYRFFRRKG